MSSRKKGTETEVPKAVLKRLAHADEITLKRRLASVIKECILSLKTSKELGCEIELIDTGPTQPLSTTIRIEDQYFSIRVQEHR